MNIGYRNLAALRRCEPALTPPDDDRDEETSEDEDEEKAAGTALT